jgi:NADPH2:quinone reductase
MKAAYIKKTGGPDQIQWGDLPDPKLGEGQLLIRTIAVAANPVDAYIRSGKFALSPSLKMPHILGIDLVGEVVHVGKGVKEFFAGMLVWSNSFGGPTDGQGSFAELVVRDANYCFALPNHADPIEAVAVLQSAATVCRGFIVAASLRKEDVLLVNGGAGNVGTAMIQLGKARGAHVIATSNGAEKLAWCKKQGADYVIDYKKGKVANEIKKILPNGVDVFWDTSRDPDFDLAIDILAHKGRIVVASGSESPSFDVNKFYQKECAIRGFTLFHATPDELAGYAVIINRALEEGILKPKIAAVLPLSEAKKAHVMLEDKNLWGRIVLVNGQVPKKPSAAKTTEIQKKVSTAKAPVAKKSTAKKPETKKTIATKKPEPKKPAPKAAPAKKPAKKGK